MSISALFDMIQNNISLIIILIFAGVPLLIGSTAADRIDGGQQIRLNDLRFLFMQPIAGNGAVLLYDLCHMVEFLRISGVHIFLLHPGTALLDRTGLERTLRHPFLCVRQAFVAAKPSAELPYSC